MGLLNKFDLSTDFTQFFLVGLILFMTFALLLTWRAPKNKGGKKGGRRGGKVDDRFATIEGELID